MVVLSRLPVLRKLASGIPAEAGMPLAFSASARKADLRFSENAAFRRISGISNRAV